MNSLFGYIGTDKLCKCDLSLNYWPRVSDGAIEHTLAKLTISEIPYIGFSFYQSIFTSYWFDVKLLNEEKGNTNEKFFYWRFSEHFTSCSLFRKLSCFNHALVKYTLGTLITVNVERIYFPLFNFFIFWHATTLLISKYDFRPLGKI